MPIVEPPPSSIKDTSSQDEEPFFLLPRITDLQEVEDRACAAAETFLQTKPEGATDQEISDYICRTDPKLYEQLQVIEVLKEHDRKLAASFDNIPKH